jgi:tetratricopeptide (TPR) repeat protein
MQGGHHVHPAVKNRLAREHAKAVKAARDAVAAAHASCGKEHPRVAAALAALGKLHQGHSEFELARTAFEDALRIREQHAFDAVALATALRDLARLYDVAGQGEKARPLLQRAARVESEAFQADIRPVASAEPEYDAHAEFVEDMAGSAPKTFWTQTLGGLLLPAFLAFRGVAILTSGRMIMYLRGSLSRMVVEGAAAHMAGLVWLCAAAFAHFHFFWPYRNRTLCSYGKTVSFIAGILLLFAALTKMWMG